MRTCFLRVHQPDGEATVSIVLPCQRAANGRGCLGIELGPMGAFTLRYVRPCRLEGKFIGYLELGMEIEHMTEQLAGDMNNKMLLVIRKQFFNREHYEAARKTFGFSGRWNDYPLVVAPYQTDAALPDEVGRMLAQDL